MPRNVTRIIFYAPLVLGVLWLILQWQVATQGEDAQIIRAAEQALATGKAYRAHLEVLKKKSSQAIQTVRIRDTVIVRLDAQLVHDTSARDSIVTLLLVRDTLLAQRDSLVSAVRFLTMRADTAETRVAVLERHLASVLTVADCHILGAKWLPRCPSRSASFLIGGGVVGVLALARR